MISEEHWRKNDEILFQNVYGGVSSFKGTSNAHYILFCDFLFHGYPCMTKENVML